ncbi:MAG: hypothetical protein CML46_11055 [Rhodobacteraceae bacterium]|nr:hypothetical protein [Paracoccaceae bacterium]MBR27465.1 hypothetical protein [Paracoccaceae bacterium]
MIRRFLSAAMLLCAAPSGAQTPGLPTVGLPTPQIPAPHDGGRGPGPLPFPGGPIAGPAGWAGAGALALLATGIPDRLSGMMDDAAAGLALGAPADCLRRLQSMALAGGLARAMLPFSDAWTLEDARGPVVRLRVVIAGLQRHQDSWCEGGRLAAETLPWGKGEAAPRAVETGTLDLALAGMTALGMLPEDVGAGAGTGAGAEAGAETGAEAGAEAGTSIVLGPGRTAFVPFSPPPSLRAAEAMRLRDVLSRNWALPRLHDLPDWRRLGVTLLVRLDPSARLAETPEVLRPSNVEGRDWDEATELAIRAVEAGAAEGFRLPAAEHARWSEIVVTFDPVRGIRF